MRAVTAIAGVLLIALALWDAFETIIMARRVARRLRITRVFYRSTWKMWVRLGNLVRAGNPRENFLSIYGPLSLLMLLAIWALTLIVGFALLHGQFDLFTRLYFSGTTFFTLGLGDVHTTTHVGRILTVIEAGLGFGFLAIVISYLPGLSEAYSQREVHISLLDERAGSPPTALELLRRHEVPAAGNEIERLLDEWERWAAELLESHISFPVLAYFRSQHDNQSWVAALTAILDTCALLMARRQEPLAWRARLTFAMARHAVVDLSHIFEQTKIKDETAQRIIPREIPAEVVVRLRELQSQYEPYCRALSNHLAMPLPTWSPPQGAKDNWQGGS